MAKVKAYIVNGLGIGCHGEVADAFNKAGAEAEIVHIKQILSGEKRLSDAQILNLTGGFLHGDILGAGMCAANELEHSGIKDKLLEYAEKGNIIYGQCNGFQLLVKTGLLPGIDNDYSKQTVTLTHNDCGNYRVSFVPHIIVRDHFAFEGVDQNNLYLWGRHGEGKIKFYSEFGSISEEEAKINRDRVNSDHVLSRYVVPGSMQPTEDFPWNPNGSDDGIAGLVNSNGHIFGHMAHTEVSVYHSRDPRWFFLKDAVRRLGVKAKDLDEKALEGIGLRIFQNIVNYVK